MFLQLGHNPSQSFYQRGQTPSCKFSNMALYVSYNTCGTHCHYTSLSLLKRQCGSYAGSSNTSSTIVIPASDASSFSPSTPLFYFTLSRHTMHCSKRYLYNMYTKAPYVHVSCIYPLTRFATTRLIFINCFPDID